MFRALKWLYSRSVFAPITRELFGVRILVTMFHRSSATLYAIYALWGLLSTFAGVPTLGRLQGAIWQIAFSAAVFLVASIAAYGATFFPRHARTELFAGASFIGLAGFYILSLIASGIWDGSPARAASGVLYIAFIVIPIARSIFIYKTLIRQSEERELNGET